MIYPPSPPKISSNTTPSPRRTSKLQTRSALPRLSKTNQKSRMNPIPGRTFGTNQADFRELVDNMAALVIASRDFLMKNNVDIFDSTFSLKFSRLISSFQSFCQQSNNSLGVFKPQNQQRSFSKSTQLYKKAEKFSSDFIIYSQTINVIHKEGIQPYHEFIGKYFIDLINTCQKIRQDIRTNMFSCGSLFKSLSNIEKRIILAYNLFESLFEVFGNDEEYLAIQQQILSELKIIISLLNSYFLHTLPSDVYNDRQSAQIKNAMVNSCAEITDLIQSMERFPSLMTKIKDLIELTTGTLLDLFKKFSLPFIIKIPD